MTIREREAEQKAEEKEEEERRRQAELRKRESQKVSCCTVCWSVICSVTGNMTGQGERELETSSLRYIAGASTDTWSSETRLAAPSTLQSGGGPVHGTVNVSVTCRCVLEARGDSDGGDGSLCAGTLCAVGADKLYVVVST